MKAHSLTGTGKARFEVGVFDLFTGDPSGDDSIS